MQMLTNIYFDLWEEKMDNNNMYNHGQQSQEQQEGVFQQQTYQQPYQQPYQNNSMGNDTEQPMSYGEWMLTLLLLAIPCVNIIMLFVWAFGKDSKTKSNFAKASLTWTAIMIVLYIILLVVIFMTAASVGSTF